MRKWVTPETEQRVGQRARDRANEAKWNLEIAVFLFGVLAIVIILLFQGTEVRVVGLVAVFGLAAVEFVGWRQGRQVYPRFYDEELIKEPDEWKDYYMILGIAPGASPKTIADAYEHLSLTLSEAESNGAKSIPAYPFTKNVIAEALHTLSDATRRAAYDRVFWERNNVDGANGLQGEKLEIVRLMQSVADDAMSSSLRKGLPGWRTRRWNGRQSPENHDREPGNKWTRRDSQNGRFPGSERRGTG